MILVKDINPGPPSSSPNSFFNLNDKLVFLANDGVSGVELWTSDGTSAGTTLIKDINPGISNSSVNSINLLGNELWFTANDGTHGTEIWKTDGTTAGTGMIADIIPGPGSVFTSKFLRYGNAVYFAIDDGTHGTELWKYDETTSVASMVKDLNPGTFHSAPNGLTIYNNLIYFTGFNLTYGTEIFKSDGTEAGTDIAIDIVPGFGGSSPSNFMKAGNMLYFVRNISFNVNALYSSDGTTVTELMQSNTFQLMTEFNNKLAFLSNQRQNTPGNDIALDLSITDGTIVGTTLLRSFGFLGSLTINPYELCAVNNNLFFRAGASIAEGLELWKTDGTPGGTMLVRDMRTGASSFPTNLTNVAGKLFFTADPLVTNFYRICRSDGTFDGTVTIASTSYGFFNRPLVRYSNGMIYMGANYSNQNLGVELIRTPDGVLGPLPVTWLDFTAIVQNKEVVLQWKTSREVNNDHFEIERSVNGADFGGIGRSEPDKSTSDSKTYRFTDLNPNAGTNYYRIKQVDHDGKFSYSRIAIVEIKSNTGIQITPNPSTDFIMISMNADQNPATIRIFDAGGRLVFSKTKVIISPARISVDRLPKGHYVVEVRRKGAKHTQKFFKQ